MTTMSRLDEYMTLTVKLRAEVKDLEKCLEESRRQTQEGKNLLVEGIQVMARLTRENATLRAEVERLKECEAAYHREQHRFKKWADEKDAEVERLTEVLATVENVGHTDLAVEHVHLEDEAKTLHARVAALEEIEKLLQELNDAGDDDSKDQAWLWGFQDAIYTAQAYAERLGKGESDV